MIRKFTKNDLSEMTRIWNDVVLEGNAFPQRETMNEEEAYTFFSNQYSAVYEDNGKIEGLYILHPNNVGRCGHIANASYAVDQQIRGKHIGEKLVKDCLVQAKELGYKILQFNAVVADNIHAIHLYQRLGFETLGRIPHGYQKDSGYEDIYVMYKEL